MDILDTQRTERIGKQSVRTIRSPIPHTHRPLEDYYFPVNIDQVRDLEEIIHTRLEMLNLTKKAEDAAKVVFNEALWAWFSEAQENSTTSARGCIAPIVMFGNNEVSTPDDFKGHVSNRWGYICPNLCEKDSENCPECPPSFKEEKIAKDN